jgi:stress-induced morphogen
MNKFNFILDETVEQVLSDESSDDIVEKPNNIKVIEALEKHGINSRNCIFGINTFGYYSGHIVSDSFNEKSEEERQALIWNIIRQEISSEDIAKISGIMPLTVEEYNRIVTPTIMDVNFNE